MLFWPLVYVLFVDEPVWQPRGLHLHGRPAPATTTFHGPAVPPAPPPNGLPAPLPPSWPAFGGRLPGTQLRGLRHQPARHIVRDVQSSQPVNRETVAWQLLPGNCCRAIRQQKLVSCIQNIVTFTRQYVERMTCLLQCFVLCILLIILLLCATCKLFLRVQEYFFLLYLLCILS